MLKEPVSILSQKSKGDRISKKKKASTGSSEAKRSRKIRTKMPNGYKNWCL